MPGRGTSTSSVRTVSRALPDARRAARLGRLVRGSLLRGAWLLALATGHQGHAGETWAVEHAAAGAWTPELLGRMAERRRWAGWPRRGWTGVRSWCP